MIEYLKVIKYDNKIRLGNQSDGGYVVADIPDYDCYISAGIGNDESFSTSVLEHFKIREAHAFDGTITSLPENCPKNMNCYQLNIGPNQTKTTANLKRFINNHNNIFLKMDIEGAEYPWLETLSLDNLNKFKQIIIEFHSINDDGLDISFDTKTKCAEKLSTTHYVIHAHGNNCCNTTELIPNVIEITYVRKDVIGKHISFNTTPLPIENLDYPNIEYKEDIDLNFYPFVTTLDL